MDKKNVFTSGLRMQQLTNRDLAKTTLVSIVDVISRRTSEGYAVVVINDILKKLEQKYDFLKYVEIRNIQYSELLDTVKIDPNANSVSSSELGKAIKELIKIIAMSIGKNAGYYFIKEIKENIPLKYESKIKEIGIDLDVMQHQYMTNLEQKHEIHFSNSQILRHVLEALLKVLQKETNKNTAVNTIRTIIDKLSRDYLLLKYVRINSSEYIQTPEFISIMNKVDAVEPNRIGVVIQRIIQEVNKSLKEKEGDTLFIEQLKNHLSEEYFFILEKNDVNLDVIQFPRERVIKQVIKALLEVLSEASTPSYAVMIIDNVIKKIQEDYDYLKYVKIDSTNYSEGIDAISVFPYIYTLNSYELGKAIQKFIEMVVSSLGKDAGGHFVERFKKHLGKAYLLRMEDMGVNLHMVELRQNLVS